ncbi:relaxase/mobilization nuclease-like protein [Chitinophaga sp. S165]|nr:relaxase/mobilization nuclease-like protein [Chitinophaga sp. S165]
MICGKGIRRLLSYNEVKVKNGDAHCIAAEGFGLGPERLNFYQKINRFNMLTERSEIAQTNAIHISLNFPPEEILPLDTMRQIASDYMERIGFADQPYLVYEHTDAGHPHMHIVTTCIRADGSRIPTHYIGRDRSGPARIAIEQEYGLIPAKVRGVKTTGELPADWLKRARYGDRPTKATIAAIVGGVISNYRFGSLSEYNAVLRHFGVLADPGKPGSSLYEHGGLVYRLLDDTGAPKGVGIKASILYKSPTLANLQPLYVIGASKRKAFAGRLTRTIDKLLIAGTSLEQLSAALEKEDISLVARTNPQGIIYGFTFIDHLSCTVFNGNALGKKYSAHALLRKLPRGENATLASNLSFVSGLLQRTNFTGSIDAVLQNWKQAGLQIVIQPIPGEAPQFWLGRSGGDPTNFVLADKSITAYLLAAGMGRSAGNAGATTGGGNRTTLPPPAVVLLEGLQVLAEQFCGLFAAWLEPEDIYNWVPAALLREAKKKKRKKRRLS